MWIKEYVCWDWLILLMYGGDLRVYLVFSIVVILYSNNLEFILIIVIMVVIFVIGGRFWIFWVFISGWMYFYRFYVYLGFIDVFFGESGKYFNI